MKVLVYKCRFTGKLFEEKNRKKYIAHLKKLRATMAEQRRIEYTKKTFKQWLVNEKKKIHRPEDIPEWFMKNQRTIMDAMNAGFGDGVLNRYEFYSTDKFIKLSFSNLCYNRLASNSHVRPDNGVGNWCGQDKTKPTGYKGWTGRVDGVLTRLPKHSSSYPYAGALNAIGIKTGAGGGGNSNWGYGVTIFVDDWPGLQVTADEIEQKEIIEILKGER